MGDHRVAHQQLLQQQQHHQQQQQQQHRHHQRNGSGHNNNNEVDMLVHSESPHIQEFRLYRELSKEIEKSSQDRVRYVDSELYLRSGDNSTNSPATRYSGRSGPSETQSAIINIGVTPVASGGGGGGVGGGKLKPNQSPVKTTHPDQHAPSSTSNGAGGEKLFKSNNDSNGQNAQPSAPVDNNCQVCLIRELKDDLTSVTKLIQERNEQLASKLKARRLRTFFERQMLD